MIRRITLKFIDTGTPGLIAYQLSDNVNGDKWRNIVVILNGNPWLKNVKYSCRELDPG